MPPDYFALAGKEDPAVREKSSAPVAGVDNTRDDDGPNTDAIRDAFEERAAIMEFEGGLSRADAERMAHRLAPVIEFVTLRGGLVLPVPAIQLALDLERRGITLTLDSVQQVQSEPADALTETDQAGLRRWGRHLAAILTYECPDGERPQ